MSIDHSEDASRQDAVKELQVEVQRLKKRERRAGNELALWRVAAVLAIVGAWCFVAANSILREQLAVAREGKLQALTAEAYQREAALSCVGKLAAEHAQSLELLDLAQRLFDDFHGAVEEVVACRRAQGER